MIKDPYRARKRLHPTPLLNRLEIFNVLLEILRRNIIFLLIQIRIKESSKALIWYK